MLSHIGQKTGAVLAALTLITASCGGGSALNSDAGEDFTVSVGDAPVFDGCDSTGDISNYSWIITEAPTDDDAGKAVRDQMSGCSFTLENAMVVDDVGEWTIELRVTDGSTTATDEVVVQVVE